VPLLEAGGRAARTGRVDRQRLEFVDQTARATDAIARLHDAAGLLRTLPAATVPEESRERITRLLERSGLG
jgi:hypothetical protein